MGERVEQTERVSKAGRLCENNSSHNAGSGLAHSRHGPGTTRKPEGSPGPGRAEDV